MLCAAEQCTRNSVTKAGYCVMHYKRWKRNGEPIKVLQEYSVDFKCTHCGGTGPFNKGLCNACAIRKYRKGYVERDVVPKGSGTITVAGYRLITIAGERVYEHRTIMEKKLGRFLLPEEVVHHKDKNTLNNDPDNLEVFSSNAEHMKHHRTIGG